MEEQLQNVRTPIEDKVSNKFTFTIPQDIREACQQISSLIMVSIIQTKPDSAVRYLGTQFTSYARWTKNTVVAEYLQSFDHLKWMDRVRDQGPHDTCWAVVLCELISAQRFMRGDDTEYTEYSAQYLVDYACPQKTYDRTIKKKDHYCYTHTILKAAKFVRDEGVPLERHWPYIGCRMAPPPEYTPPSPEEPPRVFIVSAKALATVEEALEKSASRPIGCALALFRPDYETIKDGIYRGPMYHESKYNGLHGVSLYRVGVENGEAIGYVKSSHGKLIGVDGCLKVSLEVLMVEVPGPGCEAHPDLKKPRRLLSQFCYIEI